MTNPRIAQIRERLEHAPQGWMCAVDWGCELGNAEGPHQIYLSEQELIAQRPCVSGSPYACGTQHVLVLRIEERDELLRLLSEIAEER